MLNLKEQKYNDEWRPLQSKFFDESILSPDYSLTYYFSSFVFQGCYQLTILLKIIKEMFALYTCELLLEFSRKAEVFCIHLPNNIWWEICNRYRICPCWDTFPSKSHLSPVSSWPRPRWPLAPPGHKTCNCCCNPAKTEHPESQFLFLDLRSLMSNLSPCQRPLCHVKTIVTKSQRSLSQLEKVCKRCNVSCYLNLTCSHVEQGTSQQTVWLYRWWNIKELALN